MNLAAVLVLFLALAAPAWSGPHEKGDAAAAKGNYAAAVKFYRKAAARGNHWSENSLGTLYEKGQGVPQDLNAAFGWFRKAAESGNHWGQYNLGRFYDEGIAVKRDPVAAARYFTLSSAQGNDWASYRLGQMYASGTGTKRDAKRSEAYYLKAAKAGNDWAQYALAEETAKQAVNRPERMKDAIVWYQRSAAKNNPWATYKLALIYLEGRYVEKNPTKAAALLKASSAAGNDQATQALQRLAPPKKAN